MVREATIDGFLPVMTASWEPDVGQMAADNMLPSYICRDPDGQYNVQDITTWLFLTMSQPDPEEGTTSWFWGLACAMFADCGKFGDLVSGRHELGSDPPSYEPRRFVQMGEFNTSDIALHLHQCSLMARDANMVMHDLAKGFLAQYPTASEPDWSMVPIPRPLESRPTLSQRWAVSKKKKGGRTPSDARTLTERIAGPSSTTNDTVSVPAHDGPPGYRREDVNAPSVVEEHENMAIDGPQPSPMVPG